MQSTHLFYVNLIEVTYDLTQFDLHIVHFVCP